LDADNALALFLNKSTAIGLWSGLLYPLRLEWIPVKNEEEMVSRKISKMSDYFEIFCLLKIPGCLGNYSNIMIKFQF
jgi:hypothetical protein